MLKIEKRNDNFAFLLKTRMISFFDIQNSLKCIYFRKTHPHNYLTKDNDDQIDQYMNHILFIYD